MMRPDFRLVGGTKAPDVLVSILQTLACLMQICPTIKGKLLRLSRHPWFDLDARVAEFSGLQAAILLRACGQKALLF